MKGEQDDREIFERRLTRRSFVGGSLALLAGGSLLAACGGDDEAAAPAPPPAEEPPAATAAETAPPAATDTATEPAEARGPVPGGTLLLSSQADPERLGTNYWGFLGFSLGNVLFDRLVELSEDGTSIVPGLAAELPQSPDGKVWTFTLRDGVTFHDGSVLTAEDVKYSIERQLDPENVSDAQGSFAAFGFAGQQDFIDGNADEVPGIRVVDPLTVEMTLDNPSGALPYWLTMTMASIVPKAYASEVGYEAFEKEPVGSGPYRLSSYEPASSIVLERNADYWQPDVGYVERIEWQMGVDPELAVLRIQNGEQDLMFESLPAGKVNELRETPTYLEAPFSDCFYASCSLDHEALSDLRVRQAVHHAIDKEKLVRQLAGLGEPATGGLFSPLSSYWQAADFPTYPYDPDRATALLAEAGYADGFAVELFASQDPPTGTIGQAVQADLSAVGITVDAKIQPSEVWLEKVLTNPPGMVVSRWELPYPHGSYVVDGAWDSSAIEAGCCNFSNLRSDEVDALAAEARSTPDPDRQIELYMEIDRITVGEQALWIPLFYPKFAAITSERLGGFEIPGTPTGDTKFLARYWIEES